MNPRTQILLIYGLMALAFFAMMAAVACAGPREELGKQLYFDPRVSKDGTTSCASCHDPALGYADGRKVAVGLIQPNGIGKLGIRNTPTALIAFEKPRQFHDGRAGTLEEQALGPIANPAEMGQQSVADVMNRLRGIPGYRQQFLALFGRDLNRTDFGAALAAFERTLVVGPAPIDKFLAGDKTAISASAQRGVLIAAKSRCFECHQPDHNFRDGQFHNTGVSVRSKAQNPDAGRSAIAGNGANNVNVRAWATPSWRTALATPPYMHDGSLPTLADVVQHYDSGAKFIRNGQVLVDTNLDSRIKPLKLSAQEKSDLVAMLESCQGSVPIVARPQLPK